MGKFYVKCEVTTEYPFGDSRENVNEIHSQSFDNLQESPFEAKDVILPYTRQHAHTFWHLRTMKARSCIL